jgi:hypothetical protein
MSDSAMPSVFATSRRPLAGVWVGAQISMRPSRHHAVQFIGSSVAWARNG